MNISQRYIRQVKLKSFGPEAQEKLSRAKVVVVGAGGLGVPAILYLAAMGVGTIAVVDGDVVSINNLNRQVIYLEGDVGKLKTEVAAKSLRRQNPEISVISYPCYLTVENALSLLQPYDVVIDATDNYESRYLINDACVILGKTFVYGALHGFEGHVSVFNHNDGPTYRCLFPHIPNQAQRADCNETGVLGVVPGIIGCKQALEAVKVLTGVGKPLSGVVEINDFLTNDHYKAKLKALPENKKIDKLQDSYRSTDCKLDSISSEDLKRWFDANKKFNIVDVREDYEFLENHFIGSLNLPLHKLQNHSLMATNGPVVFVCQKGHRSLKALQKLKETSDKVEAYSLMGGLEEWYNKFAYSFIDNA